MKRVLRGSTYNLEFCIYRQMKNQCNLLGSKCYLYLHTGAHRFPLTPESGVTCSTEHLLTAVKLQADTCSSGLACVTCPPGIAKLFLFRQGYLLTPTNFNTSQQPNDLQLL